MKQKDVKKLRHGLYRINWKVGGFSLASVGSNRDGRRWFAPTNWCGFKPGDCPCTDWRMVESVNLLLSISFDDKEGYKIESHD